MFLFSKLVKIISPYLGGMQGRLHLVIVGAILAKKILRIYFFYLVVVSLNGHLNLNARFHAEVKVNLQPFHQISE